LHANSFRGICIKLTNEQANSMRKQLISFAKVIKFLQKKQAQGGLTPTLPLEGTPGLVNNTKFNE